jgi:putative ABC transport system substrate-binding protein
MGKAIIKKLRFLWYISGFLVVWILIPISELTVYGIEVSVIISDSMRPYLEASDGLTSLLSMHGIKADVTSLDKYKYDNQQKSGIMTNEKVMDVHVGIGPSALQAIMSQTQGHDRKIIYSMVVNPYQIVSKQTYLCGVPLNIPADLQLDVISRSLPNLRRFGLLFDPRHNNAFFEQIYRKAEMSGLVILPIEINEKKEIPSALQARLREVDAIWMIPDRTVISESVIEYVIKESLLRSKPVFGYNRFFHEKGAAAAFVFDYVEIGRQTGELLLDVLGGSECKDRIPRFKLLLNSRVVKALGLRSADVLPDNVESSP